MNILPLLLLVLGCGSLSQAGIKECSVEDKEACFQGCVDQGLTPQPGTECSECLCFNPCIVVKCDSETVCVATQVVCVTEPCPPLAQCVPKCTGGRVLEPCFNGCPHNPRCSERLRPCDPLVDMCEPRCICPPGKPFINGADECVTLQECSEDLCEFGEPVEGVSCGLGGQECPSGSFCVTSPNDLFAVCCPSEPKPTCPPFVCAIFCPFGNQVDENGCVTCGCNEGPCEYGEALESTPGELLNCGRGGKPCPQGSSCVVHPADLYAVCCPDKPVTDVCDLDIAPGPCKASIPRWAFDVKLNICVQFIYGGCKGNKNNFETFEECRDSCHNCPKIKCRECENGNSLDLRGCKGCSCKDTCCLEADTGPCEGLFPKFYHNPATRQCKEFIYGGCDGNANRFETRDECFQACEPCPIVDCYPPVGCPLGFQTTPEGCGTCTCLEASDICSMPAKVGCCTDFQLRYYFNTASGKCEPFIYGGCTGNRNNFENLADCEAMCPTKLPRCSCP